MPGTPAFLQCIVIVTNFGHVGQILVVGIKVASELQGAEVWSILAVTLDF